jgi:arylsulfatase A-like enzyme
VRDRLPGTSDPNRDDCSGLRLESTQGKFVMKFSTGVVAAALAICSLPASAAERPPNVIFFLIDDLGATDLGCCGSEFYETPNIDRLAREGVRFTQAYSACTVCSPTRAAFLTGKYPARLHITDWIPGHVRKDAKLAVPDWTMYLPRRERTIATALKESGFVTGHIGKWHLGNKQQGYADAHGFDFALAGTERGQPPSYFSPYKIPTLSEGPKDEYLTDREAIEACKFIEANREKPFFLYLPHYAVHTPLQAKRELIEKFKAKIKPGQKQVNPVYAAMIFSLDEAVGRILAKLTELKIDDQTIVIFTSDNGGLRLRDTTYNLNLRAGKGSAYEGGVRVPLIVKAPCHSVKGKTCAEPVITVDFFPTIVELTGGQMTGTVDGMSLAPLLRDPESRLARNEIYWHYPHYHPGGATPYGAIRRRVWKLIEFFEDHRVELYNLASDPSETTDLAKQEMARSTEMTQRLHEWRKAVSAQMPKRNPAAK